MGVLLTGATGFIGRRLALLLARGGREPVRALARERSDVRHLEALGVEIVRGDVLDADAVRRAARDCRLVYHLAGLVAYERRDLPRLIRMNVESVRNVVAALPEGARLVHVSSIAAIGPAPTRDRPADETQEFPRHARGLPYPATKRGGEEVALAAAAAGCDVVVVNPAFVLGAGDVNRVSTFMVELYLRGLQRVVVDGGLSFVHVDDVAAGIAAAAERGRSGERYLLASRVGNLSYAEFFRRVGDVTGVRRRVVRVPSRLAIAGASILRWPLKPGEVRTSAHWWFGDPAKAERELGYANRPLDETIAETAAYYGRTRAC